MITPAVRSQWTLWFGISVILVTGPVKAHTEQISLLPPNQFPTSIVAIDHQNPARMFAVADSYAPCLYESLDSGYQWSAVSGATFLAGRCNLVVIDPADSAHLVLATDLGLYDSRDGGILWGTTAPSGNFNFVEFNPVQQDVVFAATVDRKLFKSSDSGKSWQFVGYSPVDEIHDIAFFESNQGRMFLFSETTLFDSEDDGRTWYSTAGRKSVMAVGSSAVADITVGASSNSTFTAMVSLSVTFNIGNSGPDPANNVRAVIQLPTGMPTPNSVRVHLDSLHADCALGAFQAVCEIPRIDPGQVAYVTLGFPMASPTSNPVTTSVIVSSDTADNDSQNNVATVTSTYGLIAAATPSASSGNSGANGNGNTTESSGGGQLGALFEMLLLMVGLVRAVRQFRG